MVACAISFLFGLTSISDEVSQRGVIALAAGVLVAPIGLGLWTEDLLREEWGARFSRWFAIGGLALFVGGLALFLVVKDLAWLYVLLGGAVLFSLVLAIASRTNLDVTIVVISIAIAWSLLPRDLPRHEWGEWMMVEDGESVLVALGDSFMSGEGAERFYEGTNNSGINECRRAPSAYPPQLVQIENALIPNDVVFLGCSGALAENIHTVAQHPGEPIGHEVSFQGDDPVEPGLDQLAHYEWLRESADFMPQLVIVSIGGNDSGFGEIARTCIGPGDCSVIGQTWLNQLQMAAPLINGAYQEIRGTFGDTVPILAIPYPNPIADEKCPWSTFTPNEHRFLNGFTNELNEVVRSAATGAYVHYVEEMRTSLRDADLRICDRDPGDVGVNFLAANPENSELLTQSLNPLSWFHNSLHPNKDGHIAMRLTLESWINAHPDLDPVAESVSDSGPHAVASLEDLMQPGFDHCALPGTDLPYCDEDPNQWIISQVVDAFPVIGAMLMTVILGAWLFSVELIRRRRAAR